MEVARAKGLDPFLGQIIPMVFSKNNASRRKMTIIISRDGQRVIAQRWRRLSAGQQTGHVRARRLPQEPAQPSGHRAATVYLWKQDPKSGEWYEVAGQSYWEEFARSKDEWGGEREGPAKTTRPASKHWTTPALVPDAPLMIAKCARCRHCAPLARAVHGRYDEAEMDRAKVLDLTALEVVEKDAQITAWRVIGAETPLRSPGATTGRSKTFQSASSPTRSCASSTNLRRRPSPSGGRKPRGR
ncbi:phage recombination protein Bet [Sinorhizobium meliloti]|nr:phage recombination protein Bet [Sinorhizobium meliloti]